MTELGQDGRAEKWQTATPEHPNVFRRPGFPSFGSKKNNANNAGNSFKYIFNIHFKILKSIFRIWKCVFWH